MSDEIIITPQIHRRLAADLFYLNWTYINKPNPVPRNLPQWEKLPTSRFQ